MNPRYNVFIPSQTADFISCSLGILQMGPKYCVHEYSVTFTASGPKLLMIFKRSLDTIRKRIKPSYIPVDICVKLVNKLEQYLVFSGGHRA